MNSIPTTFHQIFGQKLKDDSVINAIEIPIIQRDYAQGRKSKEVSRIRDQFVAAIKKSLLGEEEDAIKLDFVYGNTEDGKLIPLDGQQRLTTLFLLHWYIAKHENRDQEEYGFLKYFTYKTRFSSQHFCEKLVDCSPNFEEDNLSDWITNQNWFMYSWEKDSTIKAMLVMLDKLHDSFKDEFDLWDKLVIEQNPPISFYFLPLEEMGITDTLYIKMNSRGKLLTPFEHFKADFEKTILEVSPTLHAEFIEKVDVDWVDMFWKYRGYDDVIDDEFLRFYRFTTEMICYQQDLEIIENDFELANNVYGIESNLAETNLRTLFDSFDSWLALGDVSEFFDSIFDNDVHKEKKVLLYVGYSNLFSSCCSNYGRAIGNRRAFSLINTTLLFAIQKYLLNKDKISAEDFLTRLRIIRNLAYNSQDETRESRLSALLSDTESIMLKGIVPLKTMGFSEIQKTQEIEKINWRKNNPELIETLNRLEDNSLLQGNIAIIGLEDISNFKLLANNFMELFNKQNDYIKISRALLTIGDYAQLIGTWRFSFGNSTDSIWKDLFQISKKRRFFERTKEVLKELLFEEQTNMADHIDNLIKNYLDNEPRLKDWKYYFIKYPKMREGKSGIYYWFEDRNRVKENQYKLLMMNTPQSLNGRHWSPFLYELAKKDIFSNEVSLEDYSAPILLKKINQFLKCENSFWGIYDHEENLVKKIDIAQEDNTDTVDRIELITDYLKNKYLNN